MHSRESLVPAPRRTASSPPAGSPGRASAPPPGARVLVVHDDAAVAARWCATLTSTCAAASCTAGELPAAIANADFDAVVVGDAGPSVDDVRVHDRTARVICCAARVPAWAHDAVSEGHEVIFVEDDDAMAERIAAVARRTRSDATRHAVDAAFVTWPGLVRPQRVLELSHDGFSFELDDDVPIHDLVPRSVVRDVALARAGAEHLSGASVEVRHLGVVGDRCRVGVRLRPERRAVTARSSRRIDDRAIVAGLVDAGLRARTMRLALADGDGPEHEEVKGRLSADRRTIGVDRPAVSFPPHAVVRGTFELAGRVYTFLASVVSDAPPTLTAPARLEESRARGAQRYRPREASAMVVEIEHPLLGTTTVKRVHDVSGTGISFDLDPREDPFPVGLRIARVRLRVAGDELRTSARVASVRRTRAGSLRCGLELIDVGEVERIRFAELCMRACFPLFRDGGSIPFDHLTKFLVASKFLYPEKLAKLAPTMGAIRQTYAAIAAKPSHLVRIIVATDDAGIAAHLSFVRAYSGTWIGQHLAALPGRGAGLQLAALLGQFMEQVPELEYYKAYFRPNNGWPALFFGGFARKLADPYLGCLHTFDYYAQETSSLASLDRDAAIRVVDARGDELREVARHLLATERSVAIAADDLTFERLSLAGPRDAYARVGLERARRVLVAVHRDAIVGFALAEVSSPGLNFSELTSAARITVLPAAGDARERVRRALLAAVGEVYAAAQRPTTIVLASPDDAPAYAALGLRSDKQYACVTGRRESLLVYLEHTRTLRRPRPRRAAAADAAE